MMPSLMFPVVESSSPWEKTVSDRLITDSLSWFSAREHQTLVLNSGLNRSILNRRIIRRWVTLEMMIKQSVVGSGPIRIPGNSDSSKYLIKVVFPVEYWPTNNIIGLASKSASSSGGEWKSWNLKTALESVNYRDLTCKHPRAAWASNCRASWVRLLQCWTLLVLSKF